jgi:alpha-mannosidase
VNGFPRAGAKALLDRGIHRLFTGINEDSGGPPFRRPSAFWWKQPDGRRLFVWLNQGYGSGFDFFERAEWRRGPVPRA